MLYKLTPEWAMELPDDYDHRQEGDHVIFWKTGTTVLTTVFAYSGEPNRRVLLANLRAKAEAEKLETIADIDGELERFGYLHTEEIHPGHTRLALHAFTTAPYGCLQTSFYMDRPGDLPESLQIWKSVSYTEAEMPD